MMDEVGEDMKVVGAKDSYVKRIEWFALASPREASGISTVIVDKINQYVSDARRGLILLFRNILKRMENGMEPLWNCSMCEIFILLRNVILLTKYTKLYTIFSRASQLHYVIQPVVKIKKYIKKKNYLHHYFQALPCFAIIFMRAPFADEESSPVAAPEVFGKPCAATYLR